MEAELLERLASIEGEPPIPLPYGDDPEQFGELWMPAGTGPVPVVVLLHGGYWRRLYTLAAMNALAAAFRARGVAAWNLEYRRVGSPGGGWPGTFEDVAAGFDAVLGLATPGGRRLGPAAVLGHSAGGHLALWVASRARLRTGPGAAPRLLPTLAVSLAGVCDPREAARRNLSRGAAIELLGGPPEAREQAYAHASPAARLPLGVPQVLFHGTADDSVPFELSSEHAARAARAGDDCELVRLEGVGHFEPIDPTTAAGAAAVELTVARLRPPPPGTPRRSGRTSPGRP